MVDNDVLQLMYGIVKIALMVFTALHFFFILYLLRRVLDMQKMLSTLNQTVLIILTTLLSFGLLALIVYIIILPI